MNDDEGADLETLEPFDSPLEPYEPRETAPRRRRWLWGAVGAATVLWIALWVGSRPEHSRRAVDPVATTTHPNIPLRTAPVVPSFGPVPFGEAEGKFAAVVDGRLWLVDARTRDVNGVQGVSRARIVAVSGSLALVRSDDPKTEGTRYIVDGLSGDAVRAAEGAWFPRAGGGWWIANEGELRSGDERIEARAGFVAVAQVKTGFVVAPTDGGALELWDPRSGATRALGRVSHTRLLGSDANRIALGDPRCPSPASPRCSIEIVDVATGTRKEVPVPFPDQFVRNAVFSADGGRMAIWGTRGVALVDPGTGAVAVALKAASLATTPLAFTADGSELLVLEDPVPYRQVVVLRADTGRFVRSWVSRQQLEQIVALSPN